MKSARNQSSILARALERPDVIFKYAAFVTDIYIYTHIYRRIYTRLRMLTLKALKRIAVVNSQQLYYNKNWYLASASNKNSIVIIFNLGVKND
jgi:hypothetical protein